MRLEDILVEATPESYVVFGKPDVASVSLAGLAVRSGFSILGATRGEMSSAGDMNGDGCDDLAFGASAVGTNGQGYVLFGGADLAQRASITLADRSLYRVRSSTARRRRPLAPRLPQPETSTEMALATS